MSNEYNDKFVFTKSNTFVRIYTCDQWEIVRILVTCILFKCVSTIICLVKIIKWYINIKFISESVIVMKD